MHSPVFCCNLQTCAIFAAHCKHMRFPAAKRTGYHASSHIITSYVLKRNWKQANKKESRALFWVWAGRAGWKITFFFSMYLWQDILADQDQFPRWKSSLPDISSKSGYISPTEIIPPGHFQQIRMHFSVGNHPSQIFLANQDQSPRWKSSLTDFSSKSGCISPLGIIPHRLFQPIRMHFSVGNHPSRKFSAD